MKILLIEDKKIHQEAAINQLSDHKVTILDSFVDYFELTCRKLNFQNGRFKEPEMDIKQFDMVLTDIDLPSMNGDKKDSTVANAATGLIVALHAITCGVKMVGVYTDANHHDDAYSKGLDLFWPKRYINIVGKQKIGLLNCYSKKNTEGECVKNWALLVASLISGKIEKQYI